MKHQAGVTLVETLLCITLLSVVLSLSVSGFGYLRETQIQQITRENLASSLASARQAAVNHRQQVVMCPSSTGSTCSGNSNEWSNGWIAYVDSNGNKSYDEGEQLLFHYKNTRVNTNKVISNTVAIAFNPNGIVNSTAFQVCSTSVTSENQKISIGLLGRIKQESENAACS